MPYNILGLSSRTKSGSLLRLKLNKHKTEDLLENLEHASKSRLDREVLVLSAGIGVNGILDEREVMVVLEGKLDFALVLTSALLQRVDINIVSRNSLQLLGGEPDGTLLLVELLVCGNMVVEGQDASLRGSQVLIYEDRLEYIGEGSFVSRGIGRHSVKYTLGSITELFGFGGDRVGGGGEQRRRLGRVAILVRSHGAGDELSS
ncbi:hypothetical protein HG530_009973 [Fusarium avenaceum]|nr:hypothetical protein HG530_009973 [Fusarium avenaceum]